MDQRIKGESALIFSSLLMITSNLIDKLTGLCDPLNSKQRHGHVREWNVCLHDDASLDCNIDTDTIIRKVPLH